MTARSSAGLAVLAAFLLAPAQPGRSQDPVVVAAGDIACDPADPNFNGGIGTASYCRQMATSDLLVGAGISAVLVLGDDQYEKGSLAKFLASYDPSWGRVKAITRPTPGNHEYNTAAASGYFTYFGAAAGDPSKGWYSFDLGAWHVVVLNSNCTVVGGCGAGSPQEQWLRADLAAHPGVCTLATWHHPRFSSGTHGDDPAPVAFWRALYDAGADVVLNGHDHDYERATRRTRTGSPTRRAGSASSSSARGERTRPRSSRSGRTAPRGAPERSAFSGSRSARPATTGSSSRRRAVPTRTPGQARVTAPRVPAATSPSRHAVSRTRAAARGPRAGPRSSRARRATFLRSPPAASRPRRRRSR